MDDFRNGRAIPEVDALVEICVFTSEATFPLRMTADRSKKVKFPVPDPGTATPVSATLVNVTADAGAATATLATPARKKCLIDIIVFFVLPVLFDVLPSAFN